ncbi:MAG: prepilin-type N-terminal cleavage/methylation domain-containing protein [Candidatus Algichlamydia australiensis]|nr:prepilin-type N-terminal cleavage/methylation domain-containing protein [Chlamydiales bacterium]
MKRKYSFTLIEVMICIALMAMMGGFLAIKSGALLSKHRADSELANLKREIRLARNLSRSYQADITLSLTQTREGLQLIRSTDEPGIQKKVIKNFPHLNLINEEEILNFAGNGFGPDVRVHDLLQKKV